MRMSTWPSENARMAARWSRGERLHRLVEHLHVELEAERGDVAGLLVAE